MKHIFEVREAKPWHVGQMARILRKDLAEHIQKNDMNIHKEMKKVFNESYYRKIWLIDGKLSAIGGVAGSAISCTGFIWVALNSNSSSFPIEMVKESRRQINLALQFHSKLIATTFYGDIRSRRFIEFFGFTEYDHSDMWIYYQLFGGEK
jgi:hypothetical protein